MEYKWNNYGHVFDDVGNLLEGKNKIYIYGVGGIASELLSLLDRIDRWTNWEIGLIDRDKVKQEKGFMGRSVMSPDEFWSVDKDNCFIVIGPDGEIGKEIRCIIEEHVLDKVEIFDSYYFINFYLTIYFMYQHNMIYFDSTNIIVSTVCNLKCRDCLNFTPFIKEHYVEEIEKLIEDVDLFFNAVDYVHRFQISGGEPLLYRDLNKIIQYIGDNYRHKIDRFEIVTNGSVVPKDEICILLNQYDMLVYLDDYRQKVKSCDVNYLKIIDKFNKYRVDFVENHVEMWFRMYVPEEDEYRNETENELRMKFKYCQNPYVNLWNGHISICNYSFYAYKAGLCEWDGTGAYNLKVYDNSRKKELMEFKLRCCEKGYVEFCKKCGGYSKINNRYCEAAIQVE